jgi:hypothetical protein
MLADSSACTQNCCLSDVHADEKKKKPYFGGDDDEDDEDEDEPGPSGA